MLPGISRRFTDSGWATTFIYCTCRGGWAAGGLAKLGSGLGLAGLGYAGLAWAGCWAGLDLPGLKPGRAELGCVASGLGAGNSGKTAAARQEALSDLGAASLGAQPREGGIRPSRAFPWGERRSYQGGESPVRAGVTGRAMVRACREGVGPLAFRGYATTREPAGGEGRDG